MFKGRVQMRAWRDTRSTKHLRANLEVTTGPEPPWTREEVLNASDGIRGNTKVWKHAMIAAMLRDYAERCWPAQGEDRG